VTAAVDVLRALDGEGEDGQKQKQLHYAIFNGGKAGGSSRRHKHMQILARPRAEDGDLELLPDRGGPQMDLDLLPIVAFFARLDARMVGGMGNVEEGGRAVYEVVEKQWRMARDALRASNNQSIVQDDDAVLTQEEEEEVPHNVMITRDWVITIPRRAATIEGKLKGHVVGCQGVLGSVWCAKEEQLEAWKEVGMRAVLRELGIPGKVEYC